MKYHNNAPNLLDYEHFTDYVSFVNSFINDSIISKSLEIFFTCSYLVVNNYLHLGRPMNHLTSRLMSFVI